jgi:hypothetical protein
MSVGLTDVPACRWRLMKLGATPGTSWARQAERELQQFVLRVTRPTRSLVAFVA